MRILVVDDNPTDRELITYVIGGVEHDIDSVETLAGALARIRDAEVRHGQYDVVLLDLDLPDSRGANTFYAVQRLIAPVPVVIYSGSEDVETAHRLLYDGAADYIVKRPGLRGDIVVTVLEIAAAKTRHPRADTLDTATLLQHARAGLARIKSDPPPALDRQRIEAAEEAVREIETIVEAARERVDTARSKVVTLEQAAVVLEERARGVEAAAADAEKRIATWQDLPARTRRRVMIGGGGVVGVIVTIIEVVLQTGILDRLFGG